MIFRPCDDGPYWMTPEEKEQTRKDQYGSKTISKVDTKPQLSEMLKRERGIVSPKGNRQQIRDMAQQAGIALTYEKREIIQGWEGKPKGMEQILWERGWIDPTLARKVYTVRGTKDSMGAVRKDTSLQYLISNLKDFEMQETMLCLKAREMGITIARMPKCHCELAGEGIEYAWGCAKNHYRRQPLKDKRGRQGQFPSDCEKMFFKTSSHNRASTTVFAASPSIHSRLSQDPTRTTHLVANDRLFGRHCLSCECRKAAEEVQDTQMCHGLRQLFLQGSFSY